MVSQFFRTFLQFPRNFLQFSAIGFDPPPPTAIPPPPVSRYVWKIWYSLWFLASRKDFCKASVWTNTCDLYTLSGVVKERGRG